MKTALIVDNSELIRSMLREILLDESGVRIIGEASTVEEAAEAFRSLKPDLVFLDLIMPDGFGAEVLKNIMSMNPKTRVIILTSIDQDNVDRELIESGACVVLHKPVIPGAVKAAIVRAVSMTE